MVVRLLSLGLPKFNRDATIVGADTRNHLNDSSMSMAENDLKAAQIHTTSALAMQILAERAEKNKEGFTNVKAKWFKTL